MIREAKERERVEAQKKAEAEEQAEFEARAARRAKNRELRNAGSTAEAGPEVYCCTNRSESLQVETYPPRE